MNDTATAAERIQRVDHVAIAVNAIEDVLPVFCDALGAQFLTGGDNHETGNRLVHLQLPGLKLELMAPLREDSSIAADIRRRGTGFHHMTFFVDDVPRTVDALTLQGIPAVGTATGTPSWEETFIHPRAAGGALLQFVASTRDWGRATDAFTLEDVLAGRVVWRDYLPCLTD